MWSSVRVTAPRSRLLSRAPGSESQPATSVPPGLAAAGACGAGFEAPCSAGLVSVLATAVGCAAGLDSAGFDSEGFVGAGALGAQAWTNPAEAMRPRVC